MQPGIMITNGGPHRSYKWAQQSASQIVALIQVDETSGTPEAEAARRAKPRFELDLADVLEAHHHEAKHTERDALGAAGEARHDTSVDPEEHLPECLDESVSSVVQAAAKYPAFAAHFASDEGKAAVRAILSDHFVHIMQIERSWHQDLGKPFGT